MPKIEEKKVIREGNLGKLPITNIITSSTFGSMSEHVLLDPIGNEELFIDARLTIANDERSVRAMQKGLSGSITPKEVEQMLEVAFEKSKAARSMVRKAIGE
jgi:exosome complex RNA-binding protein Rrp42 (RNase PH superfamily)